MRSDQNGGMSNQFGFFLGMYLDKFCVLCFYMKIDFCFSITLDIQGVSHILNHSLVF